MNTSALYDYIIKKYPKNTPILNEDFESGAEDGLRLLCQEGLLAEFDAGIYYIPTETAFGKSLLNFDKVIERKYISDGEKIYGYYGEISLLNRVGVSTQVATVPSLYTNLETAERREIKLAGRSVILKRPRAFVDAENVTYLTFLEIINEMPMYYFEDDYKMRCVVEYASNNNIMKKTLFDYIPLFPESTYQKLIESRLIDYVS